MTAHSDKVRLVVECSVDERVYIKMLAAKSHMTISEFVLSYIKPDLPIVKTRKPNKKTLEAMRELEEQGGTVHQSIDDFWKEMGVEPSA